MSQVGTWKFFLLLLASIYLVAAEEKAKEKGEATTYVSGSVDYDTSSIWEDDEGRMVQITAQNYQELIVDQPD